MLHLILWTLPTVHHIRVASSADTGLAAALVLYMHMLHFQAADVLRAGIPALAMRAACNVPLYGSNYMPLFVYAFSTWTRAF